MLNKFDMVREFVAEGYLVPIDMATELLADGFDVSSFDRCLDGYSIDELISNFEDLYE